MLTKLLIIIAFSVIFSDTASAQSCSQNCNTQYQWTISSLQAGKMSCYMQANYSYSECVYVANDQIMYCNGLPDYQWQWQCLQYANAYYANCSATLSSSINWCNSDYDPLIQEYQAYLADCLWCCSNSWCSGGSGPTSRPYSPLLDGRLSGEDIRNFFQNRLWQGYTPMIALPSQPAPAAAGPLTSVLQ